MEINFDIFIFFQLLMVGLGIVSSSVIFYFGLKGNPANLPLGFAQLSISLAIWVGFSLSSQLIIYWPVFYRTGQIFALIFIAMAYLHVDFYTSKRMWKWYDLVHVLPLLIYLIDYGDTLLLPSAKKKELILQEIQNLTVLAQFNQSKFFGPNFHLQFRTFILGIYWIAQMVVLVQWVKKQRPLNKQDIVWKNWILIFLGCQFLLWFPHLLGIFWFETLTSYHLTNTITVVWVLISSLSLFFFPSLLYGNAYVGKTKILIRAQAPKEGEKKLEEVMREIDKMMVEKQFFLNSGYSIHDFSRDTNVPAYQISKCLNMFWNLGFVDYINQKRIQYCILKLEKGELLNFTLEAVASECGFSNRNSFTKSFQKFQGMSPSTYRANLKHLKIDK
jgi:AraC-like DNA-binding protein